MERRRLLPVENRPLQQPHQPCRGAQAPELGGRQLKHRIPGRPDELALAGFEQLEDTGP